MDNNLLVLNKKLYDVVKDRIRKTEVEVSPYCSDKSESRILFILLTLLKKEETPEQYEKFVAELIDSAQQVSIYRYVGKKFNLNKIIKEIPYLATDGLKINIFKFIYRTSLHELIVEEFKKYPITKK